MGFGNPYEEPYSPELLVDFSHNIAQHFNPQCIALSDTIGVGDPIIISNAFNALNAQFTSLQFSAHLHTTPHTAQEKYWLLGKRAAEDLTLPLEVGEAARWPKMNSQATCPQKPFTLP